MITLYTSLYDQVLPDVPGVPQNVALNAIRNAVIEFCGRTKIWVIDHDPISIVANESTYQFEPPNGAVVSSIVAAWFGGVGIDPTTQAELNAEHTGWTTLTGTPTKYLQENSEEVILFRKPTSALTNGLTMKVALKPKRNSTGVEAWIIEEYQEEIAHGAKARLFSMQKKPWSDAALASYHMGAFDDAIGKAGVKASKSLGKGAIRATPHYF